MGWTIFIHPQLWCRLFDCLPTRQTFILCTAKVLQPKIANNCDIPSLIQDLLDLLTDLTSQERAKNIKAVAMMRSNVQYIWLSASSHRCLDAGLEPTDLPISEHGKECLFTHAQFLKACFRLPYTLVGVLLLFTSSCRDFSKQFPFYLRQSRCTFHLVQQLRYSTDNT